LVGDNGFYCNDVMAKKLKIKRRRPLDRDELFARKSREDLAIKDYVLRREFPDPMEKKEYIRALIKGLETEPILENE